jgi:hypothetical protein
VKPGGALDVSISGFARFRRTAATSATPASTARSRGPGLLERHRGPRHPARQARRQRDRVRRHGRVRGDTNRTDNTDESWIFLRGGFGEFRFGDEDGVADNSAIGAQTIAAGTGGIDGSVIDAVAIGVVFPTNSNDATKIRYYTPSFGGFQVGVSYTPNQLNVDSGGGNGDLLAPTNVDITNLVEGALVYDGEFGGFGIQASLVGGIAEVADESDDSGLGGDDFQTLMAGVATELFGFKVAAATAPRRPAGLERDWFTAGVGRTAIGPSNTSVTYGQCPTATGLHRRGREHPRRLGRSRGMPGGVLAGDVGLLRQRPRRRHERRPFNVDRRRLQAVMPPRRRVLIAVLGAPKKEAAGFGPPPLILWPVAEVLWQARHKVARHLSRSGRARFVLVRARSG